MREIKQDVRLKQNNEVVTGHITQPTTDDFSIKGVHFVMFYSLHI